MHLDSEMLLSEHLLSLRNVNNHAGMSFCVEVKKRVNPTPTVSEMCRVWLVVVWVSSVAGGGLGVECGWWWSGCRVWLVVVWVSSVAGGGLGVECGWWWSGCRVWLVVVWVSSVAGGGLGVECGWWWSGCRVWLVVVWVSSVAGGGLGADVCQCIARLLTCDTGMCTQLAFISLLYWCWTFS